MPRVFELVDLQEEPKALVFYQRFLGDFTVPCKEGAFLVYFFTY